MRLESKTAVVTGAGSGIGRAIARRFVEEGARIVVNDLLPERADETVDLIAKQGGEAVATAGDVADRPYVERMFALALQRFGGYDILVNNAGITGRAALLEMTDENWDRVLRVNLRSMFICTQEAARYWMQEGRRGKIVNLGSVASIRGIVGLAHYVASKGGVKQFTEASAMELAPHKINVNAVGPGSIPTNIGQSGGDAPVDPAAQRERLAAIIPVGRSGEARDIANGALFLASEEADYVTGHLLVMDGGRSIAISSVAPS